MERRNEQCKQRNTYFDNETLWLVLLIYKYTTFAAIGHSPSQLMLGRRMRTHFPTLLSGLPPCWPNPNEVRGQDEPSCRTSVNVDVVRLEHSHSLIDNLENHSTASGPASCRRRRPPGNAVSGHSSTMCLVVWWLSPPGQAGDAITPHRWRVSAHRAWEHMRRFSHKLTSRYSEPR